jgi:hypothetical protein
MTFERLTAAEYRAIIEGEAKLSRRHKYGAKPVVVDGHYFPSKFEAERYGVLRTLERAGTIKDLRLQPRFPLVVDGEEIGVYVADFRYLEKMQHGGVVAPGAWTDVVEDVKGAVLQLYKLKRRLFRKLYPDLDFREIKRAPRAGRKRRK